MDERFLVHRMVRGDEAAFEEFFSASFGPLFRFALPRVGGDADAAEEGVQAALCRAVRKLATYRGEASLLTWLCTICRHEVHGWIKQRRRAPAMEQHVEELPEARAGRDAHDEVQEPATARPRSL